jgi:hypothetical protein
MRSNGLIFLLLAASLLSAGIASAETAAQFAVVGVRAPNDPDVNGLRLSFLYGENQKMSGVDFGLLSLSESNELTGVAFVLGIHKLNSGMKGGAAFSLINIHDGNDSGLNAAFINKVNNAEDAVDFGFVNIADGTTLVDIGGFNMAKRSTVQIGFINMADEITGFQFGFLNIAKNGFFPVFPIFNFPKK